MDTVLKGSVKLDRLLRRTDAAKYVSDTYGIPCSPKTLAKIACVSSEGPACRSHAVIPKVWPRRLGAGQDRAISSVNF